MSSEDPVFIELIEPVGESSPVSRNLQKGGGLHHVCIQVENLESSLQAMRAAGCVLVRNAVPAAAFDNRPIAWIYLKEGLLVELLERR
jgi:methylmalonyl-CoA/ethylmalonyl-CoA epimerase